MALLTLDPLPFIGEFIWACLLKSERLRWQKTIYVEFVYEKDSPK